MDKVSKWEAADAAVAKALEHSRVAAVIVAMSALDAAIVAGDRDGFLAAFDEESVTNNPMNAISRIADSARFFAGGKLAYSYFHRTIDYAAPRGDDEVILMGGEVFEPIGGAPNARHTVRRRFTDIWQLKPDGWKVAIRQSTVFEASPA
ncbi:nuclear transport factor 2 family protein [Qipengyuania pacifica]|uniref:nuclear transport factor 2 family protein n=1 Tax=Qipengyuania pacifica TaxID=2860199 RepID=UPI001C9DBBDC|nr:nuclear transport factor 2 family protein [Qipengyuania pacifica]MBY8335292.1 nuclear transport factor 2 family protein [Qipengyuania pacifica]